MKFTGSDLLVGKRQRSSSLRLSLQSIYTAELGVKEKTGKNDGDRVETYLRYVHLKASNPWCAAFVCWGLGQAGIPNPGSGWSPDLLPNSKVIWQRRRSLMKQGKTPEAGDVFGIWFPEKGRVAHVGFVDEWSGKYLVTVEGNTNVSGGIEGDGVYRRRRMISSVYKVADYIGGKSL
ncbi:CHAP domain-containing protein [Desertivirga xinjiangensis]|uniref:CHAP domain-containing protein n=1 Tax=Desertivirga xinjiangensis TaxID=539206 RepID=UPI00210AC77D|nr:CHAP domain-containing protein [Pedobacter xinjiangensis]